jgi:hypothetical protein
MRPHPLERRALSSWGLSRSGSPTSKPEAQREGLPDCEDPRAILDLQSGRAQQLWGGAARTQSDFEGRCRAIEGRV